MKLRNFLLELIDSKDDISLRVLDEAGHARKMWSEVENKKEVLKEFGLNKNIFLRYLRSDGGIPISALHKLTREYSKQNGKSLNKIWNEIFEDVKYFRGMSSKSKFIILPKYLTNDLAYLVGALRDGCLVTFSGNPNHFGVIFTQESCPEWFSMTVIPKLEKLFGVKPKLRYEIQIYSKPIFRFFERLFDHPPGNQTEWKTPKIIKCAPIELQLAYIQGFFDAEGMYTKNGYIGFAQNNIESLKFIKSILESQGIKCGKVRRSRNNHIFTITNRNGVERFIKIIGSQHPEKRKKFISVPIIGGR